MARRCAGGSRAERGRARRFRRQAAFDAIARLELEMRVELRLQIAFALVPGQ